MLRVGSFVLKRADTIKLLFADQLRGFAIPEQGQGPRRAVFFDMINHEAFQYNDREPEDLLLFVGHPFLLKGVDLLLEAFAEVATEFPTWRLAIIGWRIEESARQQGIAFPEDRVHFEGPQTPEALTEWMERCGALVLPSRSEGMGRVLLEAAFKGRPRIGSRVGGIPSVIEDEVDGLLFEPGDASDLARQLRRIMGDSTLRKRLGDAALARARREFTAERYVERYEAIIGELTSGVN